MTMDQAQDQAIDPVELARDLIRCPSVTPDDAGALDLLEARLKDLGFACHRLKFQTAGEPEIDNLYARLGTAGRNFCFAGHTDVVPVGRREGWTVDPFAAEIHDGWLYGRGAADMKGAIAAFTAAVAAFKARHQAGLPGSISLLITGDEEAKAVDGTVRVLDWLKQQGEHLDAALVGEPTNPRELGEMMKIGRRGSLTGYLTVHGVQGHVGYPHLADNPIPRLMAALTALDARVLDRGNAHFEASNLEITTIDCGNTATNVVPAEVRATFNIRFSTEQTSAGLKAWISETCEKLAGNHDLRLEVGAEPFFTDPGPFTSVVADAITEALGRRPELSTTGGTSDARFITRHCPVVEFGLVGQTMHKTDERVPVADIAALSHAYGLILDRYFAQGA